MNIERLTGEAECCKDGVAWDARWKISKASEKGPRHFLPVCMPTKQLHALKATLSMSPEVKKEIRRYSELWAPATSSLKYSMNLDEERTEEVIRS